VNHHNLPSFQVKKVKAYNASHNRKEYKNIIDMIRPAYSDPKQKYYISALFKKQEKSANKTKN